ncbi:MAG: MarR family winged helix-turn-helix transcriptional regulator [Thermoplasmata archaeon]
MRQFSDLQLILSFRRPSVKTLVRHLSVTEPNVSVNVSRLVALGLVRRRQSKHDLRAVELSMTPKGRRVVSRVWGKVGQLVGEATKDLRKEDVAAAVQVLRELCQYLDPSRTPPRTDS